VGWTDYLIDNQYSVLVPLTCQTALERMLNSWDGLDKVIEKIRRLG
jgi:hypothetical protein